MPYFCKVCQITSGADDHYSSRLHLNLFKACAQRNDYLCDLLRNPVPPFVQEFVAGELNAAECYFVNAMVHVHEASSSLTTEDKIVRVANDRRDRVRLNLVEILVSLSANDQPDFEAFYMLVEESPSTFELEAERVAILLGLLVPSDTVMVDDDTPDNPNREVLEFPSNDDFAEARSSPRPTVNESEPHDDRPTRPQSGQRQGVRPSYGDRSADFVCSISRWINRLQQSNGNRNEEEQHIHWWFQSFLWTVSALKHTLQHKSVYKVDKRSHGGCGAEKGCCCSPVGSLFAADPRLCARLGPLCQRYFLCQMFIDCLAAMSGINVQCNKLDILAVHCSHPLNDLARITLFSGTYLQRCNDLTNAVTVATPNGAPAFTPFTLNVTSLDRNSEDQFSTVVMFYQETGTKAQDQDGILDRLSGADVALNAGGSFICESLALRNILDILVSLCVDCKCRNAFCDDCLYGYRLKVWCQKLWNPCPPALLRIPAEIYSVYGSRGLLNREQAIAAFFSSPKGPFRPAFAIWGPPGTGKTHTLGIIIMRLHMKFHETVLAVAPTNTAADAIAQAVLVELPIDQQSVVKRAYSSMALEKGHVVPNALQDHCIVFNASNPMQVFDLRADRVIVCTVDSAVIRHGMLMKTGLFDVIVFDEAGRISIPECFAALPLAKRAIFCGDHKQLRPYVDQDKKFLTAFHWDTSILQLVIDLDHPVTQLKKNYRSIGPILGPSNEVLYTGEHRLIAAHHKLHNRHALFALQKYPFLQRHYFVKGPGLCVVPVLGIQQRENNGFSLFNLKEAAAIYQFIMTAYKAGLHTYRPEGSADITIGVVSFYNAQNRLIQGLIDEQARRNPNFKPEEWFKILSVEQFQGLQANWVLLTGCRGGPNTTYEPGCSREMGFLSEDNRLNVALTRAKYGVIVFMRPAQYIKHRFWSITMKKACNANGFSDAAGAGSDVHLFRRYMQQSDSESDD